MCRIIAIANQKGGVGKTTTCVNLGIGLARAGKKVLLVEADAQGSMAVSLGIQEPDELDEADTKDIGGIAHGQMILQLPEDEMAANKMVHYLQERKLEVEELRDYVG